ncbi:hypothetical protein HDU87_000371 [Geranomyces variabilis]|uniref:Telomere-associated protein Rif1 N-terminal domain-containing protein n=1 Tax=Geranomyces variabilis TaxID=109894 RepID=A0AAD5TNH4_9FUNG|nr:hypothetical protein HDU87_000371 [Geranomyces variabilis]
MAVNEDPQQPPSSQLAPPAAAGPAESALAHSSTPTTPSALTVPATAAGVTNSAQASLPDLVASLTAKHNDNQRRAAAWWALLQHLRALETAVPAAPLTPLDELTLAAVLDRFCKDVLIAPSADAAAASLEPTVILPQCAMRAGAYCLYRIQLLANASPDQLRAVFSAIIAVLRNSTDGKMVYLAVWSLAIHRAEPVDVLQDMSAELVEGLMRSLNFVDATEAFMKDFLAALHRLFKKLPEVCLEQCTIWFPHVFPLLLSSDAKTVEYANSFFPPVVEHFIKLRKDCAAQIKRLTESQLLPAIELMQADITHKNVYTAWGHFVASLGANLNRMPGFNAILKIVESGFNSPVDAKRIAAHKAWRRLILNFAQDGHLRTSKRTALILLPILNAFRHEKLALARQECAASYVFLLVHLSRFPPARGLIKASLLPAVAALTHPDQSTHTKTAADDHDTDDDETLDDVVSAIACFAGGDGNDANAITAISPPDLSKSFAEIDGRAKMFRRRVRARLPSRVWEDEDFAAVLAIVGMAAGRCIAVPKFRERAMPLWEGVVAYIDRSVGPPNFNLGALVEGLNVLWSILQRPDAQDHAQNLASVFTIPALKRLHEASAEHQRAQFDRAKQATKCASNLRRMMASGSRAQELMTAVISCIAKQYQTALAPGDSLAGRPHQRAQSIMDKLSSPHKPRAGAGTGENNSSPRRARAKDTTAHTPVHFFPVSQKKRKTLDANDEEVLTPKQMEKRRQLDNIPFKMYNALDRTQSQVNPAASILEDLDGNNENINNSDDEHHNTDLAAAAAAAHSDDTPPPSYPATGAAPQRQPTAHDENDDVTAGLPHVPATAAGTAQPPTLHYAPPHSQSVAFERPRVNTMPPPLSLMATENNPMPSSSFAAAVELLKARTGDLAKMHPRELVRVHISLHNIIGELIRVANANVSAPPPSRPE